MACVVSWKTLKRNQNFDMYSVKNAIYEIKVALNVVKLGIFEVKVALSVEKLGV